MFIYFHNNKLSSNKKGQLAPIFIVVLVVLIIMTFVTVNLSKVAVFKTESSNAADAGGLAAGSVMANVFNGIAQSNSQMETYYWEFYATASVTFTIATVYLINAHLAAIAAVPLATTAEATAASAMAEATSALGLACANPCAAIGVARA
ncbi:MAG: pilus assembly protein TadG-related protein, partial [Candidatus Omnitrophota bacterium]